MTKSGIDWKKWVADQHCMNGKILPRLTPGRAHMFIRAEKQARKASHRFADYAWKDFKPRTIMRKLTHGAGKHGWRDEILFSALCAWTISRGDTKFAKKAIVRALVRIIARREQEIRMIMRVEGIRTSFIAAIFPFSDPTLRLMFKNVFEAIGGLPSLMIGGSSQDYDRQRTALGIGAHRIASLMSIVHLYRTIPSPFKKKPSLNFFIDLLITLSEHNPNISVAASLTFRKAWEIHYRAAGLIYAASLVDWNGQSLLSRLPVRPPDFDKDLAGGWIRLAGAFDDMIVQRCGLPMEYPPDEHPHVPRPAEIPPPRLRLCDAMWLVEQFDDIKKKTWTDVAMSVGCPNTSQASARPCPKCAKFDGRFNEDRTPILRM